jgi:hypothetical protein
MSRPRVLAAIAAWLVVVAGTSTVAWMVISRAGDDLGSSLQPPAATTDAAGPRPSGSTSPVAAETRRTWQGSAGLIVATCEQAAIRLVSAQPASGFHAEIKDDGPQELEVEFEGREDQGGREITVVARCSSGVPRFASQAEHD